MNMDTLFKEINAYQQHQSLSTILKKNNTKLKYSLLEEEKTLQESFFLKESFRFFYIFWTDIFHKDINFLKKILPREKEIKDYRFTKKQKGFGILLILSSLPFITLLFSLAILQKNSKLDSFLIKNHWKQFLGKFFLIGCFGIILFVSIFFFFNISTIYSYVLYGLSFYLIYPFILSLIRFFVVTRKPVYDNSIKKFFYKQLPFTLMLFIIFPILPFFMIENHVVKQLKASTQPYTDCLKFMKYFFLIALLALGLFLATFFLKITALYSYILYGLSGYLTLPFSLSIFIFLDFWIEKKLHNNQEESPFKKKSSPTIQFKIFKESLSHFLKKILKFCSTFWMRKDFNKDNHYNKKEKALGIILMVLFFPIVLLLGLSFLIYRFILVKIFYLKQD